jgi:alpha-L-fucosidase
MYKLFLLILLVVNINGIAQVAIPKPTQSQLKWHKLGYYWFIHFGPNTFTNVEWGTGNEKTEVFNPTDLDCNQWCKIAKASGATQIIITAKHHDGFCLWPSKYSKHTVAQSIWKNGNGDVLKELSAACKKYNLKFGVYISPWDRNHPDYGTAAYNAVFVNMLTELLTNYGTINELWWDGANGEGENGKMQQYDWETYIKTVRKLSPNTVIFSDVGPDIRWCGNENGFAGNSNYNTLNINGFSPGKNGPSTDTLNIGNVNGTHYIPAECDVSIRPGWFYHESENNKVKTAKQLFDIYLKSVGRGANLLLNIPPSTKGLIHENDSSELVQFNKLIKKAFETDILKDIKPKYRKYINDNKALTSFGYIYKFKNTTPINCIVLEENLKNGQLISNVNIAIFNNENIKIHTQQITTVGNKRIVLLPQNINTSSLHIIVKGTTEFNVSQIKSIAAYDIPNSIFDITTYKE